MMRKCVAMLCVAVLLTCFAGCAQGSGPDVALAEFPGVKWCDTPDRVIEKLDLREEQILENGLAIPADETTEYDVWNLVIQDWTFLDVEVAKAHFVFVRHPGRNFGLMRVALYFADDTDMDAVRSGMIELYGEGTTEPTPDYQFADGILVSTEADAERTEDGFPLFWYATVTGTDVLSAQAVERFAEHIANLDAAVDRTNAIAYLNAVPVVRVICTDQDNRSDLYRKTVTFDAGQMVHILQQFEN